MSNSTFEPKWLYIIKHNTKEGAKSKFVANCVLVNKDGLEYYKSNIGKKPMDAMYKNFVKYVDGKNKINKSYCLEMDDAEFINDITDKLEWNNSQLN